MNIGQKINEFDNSTGTVEEFNRIFPQNPINDRTGILEIGGIVGVGRQFERLVTQISNGKETTFVHDFYSKCNPKEDKKREFKAKMRKVQKNAAPRVKYTVTRRDNGELIGEYFDRKTTAKVIDRCLNSVTQYAVGRYDHPDYVIMSSKPTKKDIEKYNKGR